MCYNSALCFLKFFKVIVEIFLKAVMFFAVYLAFFDNLSMALIKFGFVYVRAEIRFLCGNLVIF